MGSESDPLSLGVSPLQKSTFCCSPPFSLKAAPAVAVGRSVQTWQSHLKFQAELVNPNELEGLDDDALKAVLKEYYDRWFAAESSKYDVERDVHIKEMQIHDLEMEVSDMRGKFILPKLKKVHNFKLMGGEE